MRKSTMRSENERLDNSRKLKRSPRDRQLQLEQKELKYQSVFPSSRVDKSMSHGQRVREADRRNIFK